MENRTEQAVTIQILKDVFWEDYGIPRKVFKKGCVCLAKETFIDGVSVGVSAESQWYRGVSDGLNEDEYRILSQKKTSQDGNPTSQQHIKNNLTQE